MKYRDTSGGPVVKNLPSNAGDVSSIPGQGTKTPHAMVQLSLCTTMKDHATTKTQHNQINIFFLQSTFTQCKALLVLSDLPEHWACPRFIIYKFAIHFFVSHWFAALGSALGIQDWRRKEYVVGKQALQDSRKLESGHHLWIFGHSV